MIVMPSNGCKGEVHYLAGKYEGQVGHLYSPAGFRGPFPWLPWALDNGAFTRSGAPFNADAYLAMCDKIASRSLTPRWVLLPDVVFDARRTLALWAQWLPIVSRYGWPLAIAAQDGMSAADIPTEASVVFIGGSTHYKRRIISHFTARFPRVHVGRINTERWLWVCAEHGVESCDGTGWFRGDQVQLQGLRDFLRAWNDGHRRRPRRIIDPGLFDVAVA